MNLRLNPVVVLLNAADNRRTILLELVELRLKLYLVAVAELFGRFQVKFSVVIFEWLDVEEAIDLLHVDGVSVHGALNLVK